jgi:hypothetical protein
MNDNGTTFFIANVKNFDFISVYQHQEAWIRIGSRIGLRRKRKPDSLRQRTINADPKDSN